MKEIALTVIYFFGPPPRAWGRYLALRIPRDHHRSTPTHMGTITRPTRRGAS